MAHKIEVVQAPFDVAGFAKPYVSNSEDEEVHAQQGHAIVVKGSWPWTWGSFALSTENRGGQKSTLLVIRKNDGARTSVVAPVEAEPSQ